ncbi:MAG: hypothetical protein KME50_21845 [Nostoc desertorum CM1-VF14]|jgi:hypothetical protein|nr:hypothetical protein [Nostoc desertorum CM1-VF14]
MFLASSAKPSYESTDAKNLNLINRNLASILPDGQLQVRSPGVVTRTDPKLELVFDNSKFTNSIWRRGKI